MARISSNDFGSNHHTAAMYCRLRFWWCAGALMLFSSMATAASLERILMPGPLSQAHAKFEDDCESCHSPLSETKQQTLCFECHEAVATDVVKGTGFHGKHPSIGTQQCQACHKEHLGRDQHTLDFDLTKFNHDATDFPLRWDHAQAQCSACHVADADNHIDYSDAPTACQGCHSKDDVHQGKFGTDCQSCHAVREWLPTLFNHSDTNFPLLGQHQALACDACHQPPEFSNAPTQCVGCHQPDDVHQGSLGNQCGQCHTNDKWQVRQFDHHKQSGFALTAGHQGLACSSCHLLGTDIKALGNSTCVSCHGADDPHQGNNGDQCQSCHTTASWQTSTFDHKLQTGFDLLGAHEPLACGQCHAGALSDPVPNQCVDCHSPDPHANQLGNQCEQCHSQISWFSQVRFSHDLTRFPLLGQHADLSCSVCHESSRFHDTDRQCASCHADDDVHRQTLGNDCATCHNPTNWRVQRFDHQQISEFALLGSHATASCASCHDSQVRMKANGPDECSVCHQQDDPHERRFGSNCVTCHNNQSFRDIKRL